MLDPEHLKLIQTSIDEAPFVHLQQLYEFEFSPLTGYQLNQNGLYEQSELHSHWSKHGTQIYNLFKQDLPIGFTVVNLSSMLNASDIQTRDIADFFVMPSYRKQNIGEWMAHKVFKLYPGKWEVRQLRNLSKARGFWNKAIGSFTNNEYIEEELCTPAFDGYVQKFIA